MQIKDLSVAVESLEDVRGGADIAQLAVNGFVYNDADISIGGSGQTSLVSSPVSSSSSVLQSNSNVQTAAASEVYTQTFGVLIDRSQFDLF